MSQRALTRNDAEPKYPLFPFQSTKHIVMRKLCNYMLGKFLIRVLLDCYVMVSRMHYCLFVCFYCHTSIYGYFYAWQDQCMLKETNSIKGRVEWLAIDSLL